MSRRTAVLMFPPGDYTERLNTLWAAVQAAAEDDGPRLALEGDPVADLRAEYDALKEEATEAAKAERRFVRMEALSRGKMRDLRVKHPPRKEGDDEVVKADKLAQCNTDTIEDDLVYASIVEPEFSSRGDFDGWVDDVLSEGDFEAVLHEAWTLANVGQFNPKPLPALPTRKSAATSE